MTTFYSLSKVAELLSVSPETLRRWDKSGKLVATRHPISQHRVYLKETLQKFQCLGLNLEPDTEDYRPPIPAHRTYHTIELFAGAGGLALGLEQAGLNCILLNEIDKDACATLRLNRPDWNVLHDDIKNIDFTSYVGKVDVITGGFPCQAFSYAGKQLGFEDTRGTLFYEFARAVKEVRPSIVIGENVKGLLSHDHGKTIQVMTKVLDELGYRVLPPQVLKAIFYRVPQKRERLILVAIRKDLAIEFDWPKKYSRIYTLKDALKAGALFDSDVPVSLGQSYPKRKKEILALIPPGGYWKDLPEALQREYMMQSYFLGGGKTGMARRISWDEPCLTLTCSPAQKQTERCHPDETRPFQVREYARIQTFPDNWQFAGSQTSQYKQIGNAVPVNLAYEIGRQIVACLNQLYPK